MLDKPPRRPFVWNRGPNNPLPVCHNILHKDFFLYARGFSKAAKTLANMIESKANQFTDFDAYSLR